MQTTPTSSAIKTLPIDFVNQIRMSSRLILLPDDRIAKATSVAKAKSTPKSIQGMTPKSTSDMG
jgi:hypothetical protein